MTREQFVEEVLSNQEYPTKEYINQIKDIVNLTGSEYWTNELKILIKGD